jgi:N-acetylneuraminic acid mutarotase
MKSRIFTLMTAAMALSFSACGGGVGGHVQSPSEEWTWANGADVVNQRGTYGTEGTPAADNAPGARQNASSWTDKAGNLWLFGGFGYDASGNNTFLNDLWEYNAGEWAWMSGLSLGGEAGIYGTEGMAGLSNVPGARWGFSSWTDAAGNLWLFGGYGYANTTDGVGVLNDLWEFTPTPNYMPDQGLATGQWTWIGGSNLNGQSGTYGVQGTADPGNVPGARWGAVSWVDASGNFWLFGGNGAASGTDLGNLNDLWQYSGGEWTWVSGSNLANQTGSYGVEGMAAPGNVPGARFDAVGWIDASGNLWLFGGASSTLGDFNDLWEFSDGEWTWVSGSNSVNQPGTYGTEGTAAVGNVPGARNGAFSWIDSSGNFWLFGGFGYDSAGGGGWLNDLWEFSGGKWEWAAGSNVNGQMGEYGSEGTPGANNVPGARTLGAAWTDKSGNFWLFGGTGIDSLGNNGVLSDFWSFEPSGSSLTAHQTKSSSGISTRQ